MALPDFVSDIVSTEKVNLDQKLYHSKSCRKKVK